MKSVESSVMASCEESAQIIIENLKHNLRVYIKRKFNEKVKQFKVIIRKNCIYQNIYSERLQLIEELNFANKESYKRTDLIYISVIAEMEG